MLACADAALVSQHDQPGGLQFADDAPDPRRGQVMHSAGQWAGDPESLAGRAGDDLQVHAVAAVLAGVERPVRRHPVDRDQGPVDHHERMPGLLRRPQRITQPGGPGSQQGHGLTHITPGRGGADAEPGRQGGERRNRPAGVIDDLDGVALPLPLSACMVGATGVDQMARCIGERHLDRRHISGGPSGGNVTLTETHDGRIRDPALRAQAGGRPQLAGRVRAEPGGAHADTTSKPPALRTITFTITKIHPRQARMPSPAPARRITRRNDVTVPVQPEWSLEAGRGGRAP